MWCLPRVICNANSFYSFLYKPCIHTNLIKSPWQVCVRGGCSIDVHSPPYNTISSLATLVQSRVWSCLSFRSHFLKLKPLAISRIVHSKSASQLCAKLLKLLNGEKVNCIELFFFCNLATECGSELLWQPQNGLTPLVMELWMVCMC